MLAERAVAALHRVANILDMILARERPTQRDGWVAAREAVSTALERVNAEQERRAGIDSLVELFQGDQEEDGSDGSPH